MITSFISHRWFSGKISRCHQSIGQYRLAPGSIPGRCIFASLGGGDGGGVGDDGIKIELCVLRPSDRPFILITRLVCSLSFRIVHVNVSPEGDVDCRAFFSPRPANPVVSLSPSIKPSKLEVNVLIQVKWEVVTFDDCSIVCRYLNFRFGVNEPLHAASEV
jgi:hypothetical protein